MSRDLWRCIVRPSLLWAFTGIIPALLVTPSWLFFVSNRVIVGGVLSRLFAVWSTPWQVADVWDVLQRQREIQRAEAQEQPDADLEESPDNAFPVALVRR